MIVLKDIAWGVFAALVAVAFFMLIAEACSRPAEEGCEDGEHWEFVRPSVWRCVR